MGFQLFESVLFLFTGSLGLVVLLILSKSYYHNRLVNLFLFAFIALSCLRFIAMGTVRIASGKEFDHLLGGFRALLLINGPLFYFYFKAIAEDQKKFDKHILGHFLLPVLFVIYVFWYFQSTYVGIIQFKIAHFIFIVGFLLFYLIKVFFVLKNQIWEQSRMIHAEHIRLIRNWTTFLFVFLSLMFTRMVVSFVFDIIKDETIGGTAYYFIHSLFWLVIIAKMLISPEILYGLPHLSEKAFLNQSFQPVLGSHWLLNRTTIHNLQDVKLSEKLDQRIEGYLLDLERLLIHEHFSRNQGIGIGDVANELSVPVSHLVYLFKYHSVLTFTEYKTFVRMDDAKHLIDEGFLKTNTLESLATEVGFASYNPFFTAFKKRHQMSPNEYNNNLKSTVEKPNRTINMKGFRS
jgi:AraC-like DNA-binding protein